MEYKRRKTNAVKVGNIVIGGDAPISVQSMTNIDTHDFDGVKKQILSLQNAGCDIVRLTVNDADAVKTIYRLKEYGISVPLVADIHFDYRIALDCVAAGIDKIRINPGNIGSEDRVKAVANACSSKNIPIRIGVNSGSLEKSILEKFGAPTPEALAESAMYHASLLKKFDFDKIVISVKASDVISMINANRILSQKCDFPLHLGVTEAGRAESGKVKSAVGIGTLLCEGIGDTIRVSLTDDPEKEVEAAHEILKSIGLYERGYYDIVSCPTCGRTKIDLISISRKVEEELKKRPDPPRKITVAVMGCVVNGPGEAAEADVGIAGGNGEAVLFRKDKIIKKVKEERIVDELLSEIEKLGE